jgi:hypothetical protein
MREIMAFLKNFKIDAVDLFLAFFITILDDGMDFQCI